MSGPDSGESPNNTPIPTSPEATLTQWAAVHCPELPKHIAAVVAEWDLSGADQMRAVVILLTHVRNDLTKTP